MRIIIAALLSLAVTHVAIAHDAPTRDGPVPPICGFGFHRVPVVSRLGFTGMYACVRDEPKQSSRKPSPKAKPAAAPEAPSPAFCRWWALDAPQCAA